MDNLIIVAAAIVVVIVLILITGYVKAPTDTAVIISGLKKEPKYVIGRSSIKIPFLQRTDKLTLKMISVDVKTEESVPTNDYINVNIDSAVKVKVSMDPEKMKLAASNFLNKNEEYIRSSVVDVLQGNVREIIGQMKLEEIVQDRKKFADKVQENAAPDMAKMGLDIVSFNVQNVTDKGNVIENLGIDRVVTISKSAQISKAESERDIAVAKAAADKQANDARVEAETAIAEQNNALEIKKQELKKQSDIKKAEADAAYEIQEQEQRKTIEIATADANIAKQEKEAEIKEKEIAVREKSLDAEVKKQADAEKYARMQKADAEKYEQEKRAEAEKFTKLQAAEATRAQYEAEAEGIRAKGLAEAEAMEKKADAMAKYGKAAMTEMIIKVLPQMAEAIAKPLESIDKVSIIGGADGPTSIFLAGKLGMGGTLLGPIAVAAYSIKKGIWYDRMLTFQSETMKKIADLNSTDSENKGDSGNTGNNGNTGNSGTTGGSNNTGNTGTNNSAFPGGSVSGTNSGKTDGNDGKADNVSKYESDTSGSTSHVDSGTTLKDGVYTPDRFTWSGGTGKVQITCNKVTIQNGQAYATLVFSSDHYQYVKANGNKYYTTKGGGSATAVIPVALNQNNKIIGMTDKMSVAHEIEYTIFIYLAAANGGTSANGIDVSTSSNQKLDEQAPEIIGLEYQSETKLDYAEYFKIYHYDQGIVLLEIDMTKDTARDPEKAEETKSENEKSAEDKEKSSKKKVASVTINRSEDSKNSDAESKVDASVEESAASDNNGTSEQELAAELYKGNVVKYLIVPEDVEVPVGLEQDMIIVKKPTDHTYAESDEILNMMKDLDLLDNIAAVGMKSKDCTVSEIADKMKAKDGEKNAEVAYAGTADKLKMKNFVK